MSTKVQLTGGAFQDPAGNVLANGYLLMYLSQDGRVNGTTQIAAGVVLKINLDANGNVSTSPPQYVWPNEVISPANTFYTVSAYTAQGQRVWGPNAEQVFGTPSPYDIGVWSTVVFTNAVTPQIVTYDIGSFYPGTLPVSVLMTLVPIERIVNFSVNLVPSQAAAHTAATNSAVFSILKNGTQFCTLTFNAGSAVGVFSSASLVTFNAGDILTITTPALADPTLADVGILLSGDVVI